MTSSYTKSVLHRVRRNKGLIWGFMFRVEVKTFLRGSFPRTHLTHLHSPLLLHNLFGPRAPEIIIIENNSQPERGPEVFRPSVPVTLSLPLTVLLFWNSFNKSTLCSNSHWGGRRDGVCGISPGSNPSSRGRR